MKEEILVRLMDARPGRVSGQELGQALGVTRAAVWKSIEALRAEGFDIESAPGGGYLFDFNGSLENCKPENLEAMFETLEKYGKY